MNKKELEAFAKQAAKGIKTESDLNDFRAILTKVTVEAALNAELDHHLGYQKNEKAPASNNLNTGPTIYGTELRKASGISY